MDGIIDINNLEDVSVINIGESKRSNYNYNSSSKPSVNFGSGVELLMNEKLKNDGSKKSNGDINLEDITDLEDQLNDLTFERKNTKTYHKSSVFNSSSNNDSGIKLNFDNDNDDVDVDVDVDMNDVHDNSKYYNNDKQKNAPTIGVATSNASYNDKKTWDGFGKFNNIPIDPDMNLDEGRKLSQDELLREKFKVLRKLEEIERKGATLTKKYSMESSLEEMKGEYEMIISEKEQSNSCKFQGRMLMAAVTGLEFLNNRFDPFDIKIDGWSEQLNENIGDYDEIFGELHEKYKSKAKMAPELKLLFQLGGSAIMVHMTNTMFKSAMPGMDDIMRQNPDLMHQFTQAAVNSMSETNPGFSGFMNSAMPGANRSQFPPPAGMSTQQTKSQRASMPPNNRPDMSQARGGNNDGMSINQQYGNVGSESAERSNRQQRPEMKGPSDISDLLSGLKTKTVNIPQHQNKQNINISGSGISEISDFNVEKIQTSSQMFKEQPLKTKRKQKSDKNIISLDI